MIGLSTRGSISLGWALVAGRNRVPRPAAGKTALRTFMGIGGRRSLVVGWATSVAGQLYLLGFGAGDSRFLVIRTRAFRLRHGDVGRKLGAYEKTSDFTCLRGNIERRCFTIDGWGSSPP